MSENELRNPDGELNVEELEEVAGGLPEEGNTTIGDSDINENCGNNCHC
ncbi:MAG TPA: hypothetical protein VLK84_11295 [Longimicrobium sp.]|nr:hypothetical protein [Longimicrobium sp.]